MDKNKLILCPEGYGVNLKYAVSVSIVKAEPDRVKFHIDLVNGKQEHFLYPYNRYDEPKDELFKKVANIREIILKMINEGEQPKEVLGNINLKKHDTILNPQGLSGEGDNFAPGSAAL